MSGKKIQQDQLARYRIQVQGHIHPRWADWFEELEMETSNPAEGVFITTLTGTVADQAALFGILQKLNTLRFPLLLVQQEGNEIVK